MVVVAGPLWADRADPAPKPRAKPQISEPSQSQPSAPQSTGLDAAVIARKDWQAKPPLFAMKAHKPVAILVHHTASPANATRDIYYKMRSLQTFSQKSAQLGNGRKRDAWADVPYHYYVSSDGHIAQGRDVNFSGDTNTNYDPAGHIQVVLEGNFEKTRPYVEQIEALESLLVSLARKWQVPASEIRVHKEVASTLCPGKYLLEIFPSLNERVDKQLKAQ
ncbi:MAG: peptidoglycan recognition protein family protein [Hyphomicrobiales bacterium]|nr:peptidoglycan recognition protein family protein [Hyphomicrobiales bacterium]